MEYDRSTQKTTGKSGVCIAQVVAGVLGVALMVTGAGELTGSAVLLADGTADAAHAGGMLLAGGSYPPRQWRRAPT